MRLNPGDRSYIDMNLVTGWGATWKRRMGDCKWTCYMRKRIVDESSRIKTAITVVDAVPQNHRPSGDEKVEALSSPRMPYGALSSRQSRLTPRWVWYHRCKTHAKRITFPYATQNASPSSSYTMYSNRSNSPKCRDRNSNTKKPPSAPCLNARIENQLA